MKFQDSSFNGLKVTVGTKSVTHPPTHARTHARSKSNMPHQLFQSWGHKKWQHRFSHYKSMGIFSDAKGQLTPQSVDEPACWLRRYSCLKVLTHRDKHGQRHG